MNKLDRKAALAAYNERKLPAGIYAIRCRATGEAWVGQTLDLGKIRNRHWFALGLGNSPHHSLQAAWNDHGAEAFALDELEHVDEEESDYVRNALLAERLADWCERLEGQRL